MTSQYPTHFQWLKATNDNYGNPRRIYVFYAVNGNIAFTIDEGYAGKPKECQGLIELPSFQISISTYKELLELRKSKND